MTIAQLKSDMEASQLIDFMNQFKIASKSLTISYPQLDKKHLQKKAINFNVMLHHLGPGYNEHFYHNNNSM